MKEKSSEKNPKVRAPFWAPTGVGEKGCHSEGKEFQGALPVEGKREGEIIKSASCGEIKDAW